MAIVNIILYRSNLWIVQINYSFNALLKFFPLPQMYSRTYSQKGPESSLFCKSVPVKCPAHELEEFLIGLVEIFV